MVLKEFKKLEDRLKSSIASVESVKDDAADLFSRGDELIRKIQDSKASLREIEEFHDLVKKMKDLVRFANLENEELKELEEGYDKL